MPFGIGIGPWELIALAVVLLLLFGPSRVPGIARMLGRGVREARDPLLELKRGVTLDDSRPVQAPAPDAPDEHLSRE